MQGNKSTIEMGFCSVHRRKRTRVDLMPLDGRSAQLRCKPHRECRQRTETEMVMCSLHNRRRNIHQMKEVRKGIYECLSHSTCRGQFNDVGAPTSSSHATVSIAPYVLPPKGSRPQQAAREVRSALPATVLWAPTSNRSRNVGLVNSSDSVQPDRKIWCAKHGKLTPQQELIKDCCYVCYDTSFCLSTPLDLPSDLAGKGCKELLCSKHNSLRLVDFLEKAPDEMGYHCIAGHRCRGTLAIQRETLPDKSAHLARDTVSSFFV